MTKRPEVSTKLDPQTYVLKAVVTDHLRQTCQQFPVEFIGEARLRMAALKSDGHIEAFTVFDHHVDQIWQRFRRKHSIDQVEMVLAAGRPKLPGVEVEMEEGDGATLGWLTFTGSRYQVAQWRPQWLLLKIAECLGASDLVPEIDPAQVYGYWAKYAFNGEPVIRRPLKRVAAKNPLRQGQEVRFQSSAGGSQLEVLFGTFRPFKDPELRNDLMAQIERRMSLLAQAPEAPGYWRTLPGVVQETIEQCAAGVQSLGIGLPVNTLAGICMTDSPFAGDKVGGVPPGAEALYTHLMWQMLRLDGAHFTAAWFAQRLRIPVAEDSIKTLMAVLQARGMVETGETAGCFQFPADVHQVGFRLTERAPDAFHRTAHKSVLSAFQLGRGEDLHLICTGLAMNEASLPAMREELSEFRRRVLAIVSDCSQRQTLYQLNLQLFPLTRQAIDYRLISTDHHAQQAEDIDNACLQRLLLDLARMEVYRGDGSWLAAKLLVPATTVQCAEALAELKQRQALTFDAEQGRLVVAPAGMAGGQGELAEEAPEYRDLMLRAAEWSTTAEQIGRFSLSTMMLPVSVLEVEHIADEASLMADRLKRIAMNSRGKDQLYRVNLSIFPQSK